MANELPIGWSLASIKNLIPSGGIFVDGDWIESKDQDQNGSVRLIQLADIGDGYFRDRSDRKLNFLTATRLNCTFIEHGDILIARMPDPIGRACIFPFRGYNQYVTAVDVAIVRLAGLSIDPKFFVYLINSRPIRETIIGLQRGTTRKRVSRTDLATIELPIPPLPEQHRIVAKIEELFSSLEAGGESLKTAKEQLKVYRQAVLKWAFEGRPEIRERTFIALEEIAQIGTGATPLKSNRQFYEHGTIPWITSTALNDLIVKDANDFVTKKALLETNLRLYPRNTLLLAMYGEGKTRGKCSELQIEATTNQAIAAITLRNYNCTTKLYLRYFFQMQYESLRNMAAGGVQPNLNLGIIKKLKIPSVSIAEQQSIVSLIESRFSACDKLEEAIDQGLAQAEALRQSILKKAFEGKLVPQDPNDEPASVLLERIRAERVEAEKAKPRKKKATRPSATTESQAEPEAKRKPGRPRKNKES